MSGFIHGRTRVVLDDGRGWTELGATKGGVMITRNLAEDDFDVEQIRSSIIATPPHYDVTVSGVSRDSVARILEDQSSWSRRWRLVVSHDGGERDPFWDDPRDHHGWRAFWRWVWSIASYSVRQVSGDIEEPWRKSITMDGLHLTSPPYYPTLVYDVTADEVRLEPPSRTLEFTT